MTEAPDAENVVWSATVDDGKFLAQVMRTGAYTGQLTVTVGEGGKVLLDIEVGLAYEAIFGPDIDDVARWQGQAIAAIDDYLEP